MNRAPLLRAAPFALSRESLIAIAGAALLVLAAAGLLVQPRVALACALAAWWWALGIVLGCFVNAWMHVLTGGEWGAPVRETALVLSRRFLWLLLPGLPAVAFALHAFYPWAMQPASEWTHGVAHPGFVTVWLSPGFFTLRLCIYAAGWWCMTRAASFASKGRAAAALIGYAVLTSLAAVDLLGSLIPTWYSTAFGLIAMSTQALSGAAAVVLIAIARTSRGSPSRRAPGDTKDVPLSRDLGNLLLMWCMSWGYLAFMQFIVIWAENLPREIAWYVPRLQTGWQWVGLALVMVQLAAAFFALLFRSVKDDPRRLSAVAALLVASSALDCVWTVVPSVDAHSLHVWWIAPCAIAGTGLLAFGDLVHTRIALPFGSANHA